MFSGRVIFARDRGRLDVIARSESPSIRVAGAVIDAPQGVAGEYYLFDSAGFALVRPATKTFSVSSISEGSYNYQERRGSWPEAFEFGKPHVDTVPADSVRSFATEYSRVPIFWHLDLEQLPTIRVLARGRMILDAVPIGEASIARWFGAASALAHMPGGANVFEDSRLRITAVAVVPGNPTKSVATNLIALHSLATVKVEQIDLVRLVVPSDYVETSWFTTTPASTHEGRLSRDQHIKWKATP
jgi:hypothetical protein